MHDASIDVDREAVLDPFATTTKRLAELLLFDPQAGTEHQVKVAGVVVYAWNKEFYLMDGGYGLRFRTEAPLADPAGRAT